MKWSRYYPSFHIFKEWFFLLLPRLSTIGSWLCSLYMKRSRLPWKLLKTLWIHVYSCRCLAMEKQANIWQCSCRCHGHMAALWVAELPLPYTSLPPSGSFHVRFVYLVKCRDLHQQVSVCSVCAISSSASEWLSHWIYVR